MKYAVVFAALVGFALINTAFLGVYILSTRSGGATSYSIAGMAVETSTVTQAASTTISALATSASTAVASNESNAIFGGVTSLTSGAATLSTRAPSAVQSVAQFFEARSIILAPTSWFFVGGMWIWRGRMKSKWTDLGFDSDVFGLFVRMKGAKTRIRLLDALSEPKDRLQLAQELGLDWKAVDRHIEVLDKYGFVHETVAYGKVRMYALTSSGKLLLQLLDELNRQGSIEPAPGAPSAISSEAGTRI